MSLNKAIFSVHCLANGQINASFGYVQEKLSAQNASPRMPCGQATRDDGMRQLENRKTIRHKILRNSVGKRRPNISYPTLALYYLLMSRVSWFPNSHEE